MEAINEQLITSFLLDELSEDELSDDVLSAGAFMLPLAVAPAGLFVSFP